LEVCSDVLEMSNTPDIGNCLETIFNRKENRNLIPFA